MHRITAPTTYSGLFNLAADAPYFVEGVAYTDQQQVIAYCREAGYTVTQVEEVPAEHAAAVTAAVTPPIRSIGTPLRDAAVDPRLEDASVPTNPGRSDPHGPDVVASESLICEKQAAAAARAALDDDRVSTRRTARPAPPRVIAVEQVTAIINGRHAAVAVPIIPVDAGPALHEGLRRRRVSGALGRCPCGARRPAPTALQTAAADQGTAHMPVPHRPTCQAHDDVLSTLIEEWKQQDGGHRGAETR